MISGIASKLLGWYFVTILFSRSLCTAPAYALTAFVQESG